MIIDNSSPFPAEFSIDKNAELQPTVSLITKATYDIAETGAVSLAADQEPVHMGDVMNESESEGMASVKYESDLVPIKLRGDFVIVGQAVAPGGKAVQELDVGFRMGGLEKVLHVTGDRVWQAGGVFGGIGLSETKPFKVIDLTYENAFGGMDMENGEVCLENPVGKGILGKKAKKEVVNGTRLPNIEHPNQLIKTWKDKPEPVGFGYIGKGWQQRVGFMGTYDDKWKEEVCPERPADFNWAYFNAAPADQQLEGYFNGDEVIDLLHMTPSGRLQLRLPGIQPSLSIKRKDAVGEEPLKANLDTVCVMPSEMKVTMVWRGLAVLQDPLLQDLERMFVRF